MYQFAGFSKLDFDVFLIPEFHDRMSALRTQVRPKLAMLGDDLAPRLEEITGHPMYPHTASHARRRVNPPDDTWVAFSRSERGYKRYAHFEVGICLDYVFVRFVVKPEGEEDKASLIQYLERQGIGALKLKDPEPIYYYQDDHGQGAENVESLTGQDLSDILKRTALKSRGFTVGLIFDRETPLLRSAEFVTRAHNAIRHLAPLYEGVLETQEVR
ncbi:DUF1054 family protein [Sulfobacillus harzensis]|uniref:DUF1054 family protein n=1 Tax=Sulfobacillus harzensis TaxID=2729629 RepID=A0A7Y0L0Y2_9FIRM|nr:DUF1054 family protein [Sulfobacillus harzensis]NMP21291.1 DUF1054 family protein [Sulfobacillus harzensis]